MTKNINDTRGKTSTSKESKQPQNDIPPEDSIEKEEKITPTYRQNAGNNTQASEMMQDGRGDHR